MTWPMDSTHVGRTWLLSTTHFHRGFRTLTLVVHGWFLELQAFILSAWNNPQEAYLYLSCPNKSTTVPLCLWFNPCSLWTKSCGQGKWFLRVSQKFTARAESWLNTPIVHRQSGGDHSFSEGNWGVDPRWYIWWSPGQEFFHLILNKHYLMSRMHARMNAPGCGWKLTILGSKVAIYTGFGFNDIPEKNLNAQCIKHGITSTSPFNSISTSCLAFLTLNCKTAQ